MANILLQTTIAPDDDDWNIGRFRLLRAELEAAGHRVEARDRVPHGDDDPVLLGLPESDIDQLWIFAVDAGAGISGAECAAISRFRRAGGAVFATRDHMDLGSSICDLDGIGAAHLFHSRPLPPEVECADDDTGAPAIHWPNYHSGRNGDVQYITAEAPIHPVLAGVATLPAHPHEGAVIAPADDPTARIVAHGTSRTSGRRFNIAAAFEPSDGKGRGWAQSTFHHFADYNWDIRMGAPSFVAEPPSRAIEEHPSLLDDTRRFVRNLAAWLGERRRS